MAGVFGSACAPFLPSYINAILSPVSWAVAGGVVYSVGRAGTKKAVLARCSEKLRKGLAAASNMALDREHEEDIAGFWFVLLDYYL